ncbi:MAG: hypothetical protein ACE5HE_00155 [Phycisphaerae bacterium]
MPITEPAFLSEKSSPKNNDWRNKSLWKINGALVDILNALDAGANATGGTWNIGVLNPAATPTAEQPGTAATTFRTITFFGQKSEGTNNGGDIFIRRTQNGTGIEVSPGNWMTFTAKRNETLNLADFWVKIGTAGDGTIYAYQS